MDFVLLIQGLLPWVIFGALHSFLATNSWKESFPLKGQSYRIFYNFVSTISLLGVFYFIPPPEFELESLSNVSIIQFAIFLLFATLSIIFGILGLRAWDILGFLGLRQENGNLNTGGIYTISRHPVYTAALLGLLAINVIMPSIPNFAFLLGMGGYFVLGTIPEEKKLSRFFEGYDDYRKKVGRFFPWRKSHFRQLFINN